jgi:phage terminase large subunit
MVLTFIKNNFTKFQDEKKKSAVTLIIHSTNPVILPSEVRNATKTRKYHILSCLYSDEKKKSAATLIIHSTNPVILPSEVRNATKTRKYHILSCLYRHL